MDTIAERKKRRGGRPQEGARPKMSIDISRLDIYDNDHLRMRISKRQGIRKL